MRSDDTNKLDTVVVDLTPILAGGENGGAKVFVLELLRRLAERIPQTNFVLLTQSGSHEELALLDRSNVRRLMVLNYGEPPSAMARVARLLSRVMPQTARTPARWFAHRLKSLTTRRTPSLLLALKADLLFCPFTALTYLDADVPAVSVIYDLQDRTYPEFFEPAELAQRNRTFTDASRRSSALIAISEYTRLSAIKQGELDPERVKTIHLQISQHSLTNAPRDESVLERLGLKRGKFLIYPANFWKHKNHEILLKAFEVAFQNGLASDVRLVCTGAPGVRHGLLRENVQDAGMADQVLFTGYVSTSELLALMSNSAGMIFPSLYEGFGMPVIEAMAAGIPVACSNVTALPEIAGDAAILFDPNAVGQIAEAMVALVHDQDRTARLTSAGRARAEGFSDSGRMAEQYWEAFRTAVAMHRRHPT